MSSPLDDLAPPNPLDDLEPPESKTRTSGEDPDVAQFHKMQGRAPTQDELASIKAVKAGNPIGSLMNNFIGGPLRGAVGGWKGIASLVGGRSGEQASQAVQETTATDEPTDTGARLTNEAMQSPYNPLNWADKAGEKLGDWAQEKFNSPALSTAFRVGPDAAMAALGFRHGAAEGPSTMAEPQAFESTNPYRGAASAEQTRLQGIHDRGVAAGLDLPEGGTQARFDAASANNTQAANSIIRRHFGLPDDPDTQAPLTPEMMDSVAGQVAKDTYGPIRAEPSISLSAKATDAIDALPPVVRNKLKYQGRPLNAATPEQVSGGEFVDMSQRLRAVARSYDTAYNRGGHPEAGALADLTHDAVDALEESGRDSLKASGKGDLADKWEQGRTTIAQTHDVAAALDGAGNVNVAALRRRPYLTGDLDMLANLGGRYPDAFRVTRISQPQVGLARRAAAAAAGPIATAGGALLGSGMGPVGTAIGAAGGKVAGQRIAEKIAPP